MSTSKRDLIRNFDPNSPAVRGKLFGLPFGVEEAEIIVIPVPWEVTASYGAGTSNGPESILDASAQVDLYVRDIPEAWKLGVFLDEVDQKLISKNNEIRPAARDHMSDLERGAYSTAINDRTRNIDRMCSEMVSFVKKRAAHYLDKSKIVAVLGGDHSTPLGLIRALGEKHTEFGILQIDAHADLRKSYEGFKYSHASIMYNAMEVKSIVKLVQVGIRDICEEELQVISGSNGRIKTFFDPEMQEQAFRGITFQEQVGKIIRELPDNVYISFDIDGLDPSLCPNTGTPVPGGLTYEESRFLIKELVRSNRKIIGFDLCEVAPSPSGQNEWDANVGARVLYFLCNYAGVSQGLLNFG